MANIKKSTIFWNVIATLALISTYFIHIYVFIGAEILLFIILLGIGIDNASSYRNMTPVPFIVWLNPIGILIVIGYLIFKAISWLVDNPVEKFNTWLDTEKEKKLKFNEFKNNEKIN